ncbi:hypothetical protein [Nocardia terpenica]|uniref:hypothetical protein n=1 Tax=Nocardia terpenica TaxID=455432 RepID=UPI0012FDE6A4|nr:hypothetical protein [Nocardia terpenica]
MHHTAIVASTPIHPDLDVVADDPVIDEFGAEQEDQHLRVRVDRSDVQHGVSGIGLLDAQ